MEVMVRREDLVPALGLVQGVVERRTPQPILANVVIEPAEGGIALTATDLEVGARVLCPAQVKRRGTTSVAARKLYEIAREVAADELALRTAAEGWIDVLAGRSKFKMVTLDPKDYPELPFASAEAGGTTFRIAGGTLREMIDKTVFAVSADETRANLSGIFVETPQEGTLRLVATDGHRLAMIDRSVPGARLPKGVILPRKGVTEIRKLLDDAETTELTLTVGSTNALLQAPTVSFFMRLVEGEFPDYRNVVPTGAKAVARINRDDLLAALRRTSLLASERSHGVRLNLEKGTLEVSATNDQGEAVEDVDVSYGGERLTVGFNVRYLLDVLGAHPAGEVVEFGFTDEVGPGVVRGSQDPDYSYVVMPMRL